jgi:hypothetical protein
MYGVPNTARATSTLSLSSELNGRTKKSFAETLVVSKTIFQGKSTWTGVKSSSLFDRRFTGFSQQQFSSRSLVLSLPCIRYRLVNLAFFRNTVSQHISALSAEAEKQLLFIHKLITLARQGR